MPGTAWQSSDLLTRFNALAGRPTTDAITDAEKYQRLADGQNDVLVEIAGLSPRQLYGTPQAMSSSDGGYTWTFGTDGNGYDLFPLGMAQIYPNLNAVPDYSWRPGYDYLDYGTYITLPNNVPWAGPLYWRGITPPEAISASVQPVIQPPPSRILIVIRAVSNFAREYSRNPNLVTEMEERWAREFPKHMTMIRRHFRGAAQLGPLTGAWGRAGTTLGFGLGGGFGW